MNSILNWPGGPPGKQNAQRMLGDSLRQGWAASDRNDSTKKTRWQAFKARRLLTHKTSNCRRWRPEALR